MSVEKPSGEYVDEMLDPGGWVDVDEQSLHDRAQALTATLQQLTKALEGFQHEETEIFGGGVWSGGGANSAQGKLGEVVKDLQGVQNDLVKAITWYQKAADTVTQTKTAIADRVEKAQSKIGDLENDTDNDADERKKAIDALVKQIHGVNVSDVTSAAGKVPASAGWKAPEGSLKSLLDQKTPPKSTSPGRASEHGNANHYLGDAGGPVNGGPGGRGRASEGGHGGGYGGQGSEPGPLNPQQPAAYNGNSPNWSVPSFGGLSGGGGGHGGGGQWGSALSGLGGQGGQQNSPSAEMFDHHMLDGMQRQDVGLQQNLAQTALNNAAASAAASAAAQVPQAAADATQVAPASARGPAVTDATMATSGSAAAASGGASAGTGAMGSVPTASGDGAASGSSMPLLPPATPHAAAPVSATGGGGAPGSTATGSGGPGVHPASTNSVGRGGFGGSVTSSQAEAAPAPLPVSSARAQKEAIADATRRQGGGDAQVAYRLAAALNAPDMVNKADFKFFWMTAVTADGQIVVANSYGLAFIPDGVLLPPQVIMVSADEAVPAEERARWATYPNLALQGWAAHHDTTLRVMIAKREQFAGIDPGVPTQFVADEDIPTSGKMQGRSRLEVIAPAAAARLASASDLGLVEMLPPAPVDASPPADQRTSLWFDLMKHVMRSDAERGVAQLQSFTIYAAHAQELALYRAHSGVHAVEQRAAVADWLYWRRIGELLDEALAGAAH